MNRRQFLATCGGLSGVLAGCSGGEPSTASPTESATAPSQTPRRPPVDSCSESDVSRPDPPAPEWDEAIEPIEYPGPPPEPLDDESAVDYAERFEAAYRQNLQVREDRGQDSKFVSFSVGSIETWTYEAPSGAAVVRLKHVWSGRFGSPDQDGDGHYDSVPHFASYYVDQSMVVRAVASQYDVADGDTLSPDPWSSGALVACFEG